MQYRKLEGIDQKLSVLIYGTPWTACRKDMRDEAYCSYDHAWEAGFRAFDTANSYGDGEETLGAWLHSRGIRGEAVIIDKGCNPGQNGSTPFRFLFYHHILFLSIKHKNNRSSKFRTSVIL